MAGTLVANTINTDTGLFSTNNAYSGIAKAWANFGVSGATVTINNSFNVSSITRSSAGAFVINFTTTMPNANYCVSGFSSLSGGTGILWDGSTTNTTSACSVTTGYVSSLSGGITAVDYTKNYISILGS